MKSTRACLSVTGNQLGKLIAPDATNYSSTFTASTLLCVIGTIAKLSGSPYLAYFTYALAVGEAAVGARQWSAARFFEQKQEQSQAQSAGAARPVTDGEEFHPAPEHPAEPVAKVKKMQ